VIQSKCWGELSQGVQCLSPYYFTNYTDTPTSAFDILEHLTMQPWLCPIRLLLHVWPWKNALRDHCFNSNTIWSRWCICGLPLWLETFFLKMYKSLCWEVGEVCWKMMCLWVLYCKAKVKLSLYLTKYHAMLMYISCLIKHHTMRCMEGVEL
jgi:hypothetical protein